MIVKIYCGCAIYKVDGVYICMDRYTKEIHCVGSLEKCNKCFSEYVNRLSERDR